MEKIEELASLLRKISPSDETPTETTEDPVKNISAVLRSINADEAQRAKENTDGSAVPEEGWWDYVLKRISGEPCTYDWRTISLADMGHLEVLPASNKTSKLKIYTKFKKSGQLFEETEGDDFFDSMTPEDLEALEKEFQKIEKEVTSPDFNEFEAQEDEEDEDINQYLDANDNPFASLEDVIANIDLTDCENTDNTDVDPNDLVNDCEDDLFALMTPEEEDLYRTAFDYANACNTLDCIDDSLKESHTPSEYVTLIKEEVCTKKAIKSIEDSELSEAAKVKTMGQKMREWIKRRMIFKRLRGKIVAGMKRSRNKLMTRDKIVKAATKRAINTFVQKFSKMSMADYRKQGFQFREKIKKRINSPAVKRKIKILAKKLIRVVREQDRAKKLNKAQKQEG